jgi:hypothetical protein
MRRDFCRIEQTFPMPVKPAGTTDEDFPSSIHVSPRGRLRRLRHREARLPFIHFDSQRGDYAAGND